MVVWDERKRLLNLAKHKFDFALVEDGFDFATALYTGAAEGRVKAVGRLGGRLCVLVFRPLGEEAISLVSLRVASQRERRAYDARA